MEERKLEIQSAKVACKDAFAMMAATMNLPLSTFNNPAFHHALSAVVWCAKLGTKADFKSITVHAQSLELVYEAKVFLKKCLQGCMVAATTDHWTSHARENYTSLMVSWIENFKLYHSVLAVYLYEGSTSVACIADDF